MTTRLKRDYVAAWVIISITCIIVIVHFFALGRIQSVMPELKAMEYLGLCKGTTDLATSRGYLQQGLETIQMRTGNPNWLWGFPATDYVNIKQMMISDITMINEVLKTETPSSYAYQRAVENILRSVSDIQACLSSTIDWRTCLLPFNLLMVIVYIVYTIISWIVIATSNSRILFKCRH